MAAVGSLYFAVASLGERGFRQEFRLRESFAGETPKTLWERIELELGYRPKFARAAVDIWLEEPWFGAGGWGYKYRVADYVPEKFWDNLSRRGWANTHVDASAVSGGVRRRGHGLLLGRWRPWSPAGRAGVRRERCGRWGWAV